ncbi:MAG: DUF58 domain-containing protein [Pseudomonadota bacterium]
MNIVMRWRSRWRARWDIFFAQRHPRQGSFVTSTRTLYILPSQAGYGLLFFLAFIFLLAVNFENSLVFGLFFWLLSIAVLNLHVTHHNINSLRVSCVGSRNAYVGDNVEFVLEVESTNEGKRHAIEVLFNDEVRAQRVDLTDSTRARVTLATPATARGYVIVPRVEIRSVYPLGIARVWSYANLTAVAIAYPVPIDAGVDTSGSVTDEFGEERESRPGVNDFDSLRAYAHGDRLTRVHWPASSRSGALQVKQFVDPLARHDWIEWDNFPNLATEARIAHLSFLLEQRENAGDEYGLTLPGVEIPSGSGQAHYARCISALSTFDQREPDYV